MTSFLKKLHFNPDHGLLIIKFLLLFRCFLVTRLLIQNEKIVAKFQRHRYQYCIMIFAVQFNDLTIRKMTRLIHQTSIWIRIEIHICIPVHQHCIVLMLAASTGLAFLSYSVMLKNYSVSCCCYNVLRRKLKMR